MNASQINAHQNNLVFRLANIASRIVLSALMVAVCLFPATGISQIA